MNSVRVAIVGVGNCASSLVQGRTWDDYSVGRAGALEHLGALDLVYSGVIESHRKAIDEVGELDPVTEDMVIAILRDEQGHMREFEGFLREYEAEGRA